MKGNEKIINILKTLLSYELIMLNQYVVLSEMCANWEYENLHTVIEKQARDKMHHAEKLIRHIRFFKSKSVITNRDGTRIRGSAGSGIAGR